MTCLAIWMLFALLMAPACAPGSVTSQGLLAWQDRSNHQVRFVPVNDGVRLEVLDWGGSGRPVVLLAGGGMTAHVFDEFAPKLIDCRHVYGITRRGSGGSSHPPSGYDDQALADDMVRVLDLLRIDKPVLVGHSMASGELTTVGHQHSDRLSGLVYLDAIFDPGDSANDPAFTALQQKLPAAMREPPDPDYSSFGAYRASQLRNGQGVFPESELRQLFAENPNGTMGRYKASTASINSAIGVGQRKRDYSKIRVPVLAFIDYPRPPGGSTKGGWDQPKNDEERAVVEAYTLAEAAYYDRRTENLKRSVPEARIIDLPGAGHFVFLTREADVLRGLRQFVAALS